MERQLRPDETEVVETGYETDNPELFFFSDFWGLFLTKTFLPEGSCRRVYKIQGFGLLSEMLPE